MRTRPVVAGLALAGALSLAGQGAFRGLEASSLELILAAPGVHVGLAQSAATLVALVLTAAAFLGLIADLPGPALARAATAAAVLVVAANLARLGCLLALQAETGLDPLVWTVADYAGALAELVLAAWLFRKLASARLGRV